MTQNHSILVQNPANATVQGLFAAQLARLQLRNRDGLSELTITLRVHGEETPEIAANLSRLTTTVKVVIEGTAQQLKLW